MTGDKLTQVLSRLVQFYRQVGMGHTQVMLEGVTNTQRHPFVVVPNPGIAKFVLSQTKKCRPVLLDNCDQLHGVSGPMAWEHTALEALLRACLSRITELEAEVRDLTIHSERGSCQ
jgi:hypothetical protein